MFESALVELAGRRQSARRWLSLPVAVAFHLVVLAGICIAQYAQVDRLADPDANVVFFVPAPLPDLEPRIATGASRPVDKPTAGPARPSSPAGPVQPRRDLEKVAVVPSRLEPAEPGTGGPRSAGPFVVDLPAPIAPAGPGGPGGPGSEVRPGGGDPQGGEDPVDPILRPGNGVSRPEVVSRVEPVYNEAARRARVQGKVVVEAVIDETGRVRDAQVVQRLGLGLDRAATDAVMQWRFAPALYEGRPVKVRCILTVTFALA